MPSGTTVSFNPNPIPAPGSGNSTMTITVGGEHAAGNLSHHRDRQRRRHPAERHRHADGDRGAQLHDFGLARLRSASLQGNQGTSTITTTISGGFNSAITSVGFRHAVGHDGELQPQPDSGAGLGQLDHDHHGGGEHPDGDLSHHRDRQWRRHPAKHYRHADGDRGAQLHDFGLAVLAQCRARQSGNLDHHHHRQWRLQQRHHVCRLRACRRGRR